MSLNGLDSPEVQNAYKTAIAEAGGWFLLKYTSRDSVDLLGRGKHGVSEARNALTAYPEASPLYGLLMYRRRRILIKYIPKGTSRLLQARTSVHLQDVLERYSPYETLLEISTGDTLNDTSLAASFQLHTASPTPTSARLDEIQEDEDDEGTEPKKENESSSKLLSATRYKSNRHLAKRAERAERLGCSTSLNAESSSAALSARSTPPASPTKSPSSNLLAPPPPTDNALPMTPAESPTPSELEPEHEHEPEPEQNEQNAPESATSDQTHPSSEAQALVPETTATNIEETTPAPATSLADDASHQRSSTAEAADSSNTALATSAGMSRPLSGERIRASRSQSLDEEPYDFSKYDALFKPKIKLGPRPVNPSDKVKRPAVAKVAAVPASLKPAAKKQETPRPSSFQRQPDMARSTTAPSSLGQAAAATAPTPPPVPEMPEYRPRPYSRGSIRSAPSHKSTAMTPDKIRLMKAIELRKRQLRKSQEPLSKPFEDDVPEVPTAPPALKADPAATKPEALAVLATEAKVDTKILLVSRTPNEHELDQSYTDDESQHQSTKADSGIELRYGTPDTQHTEETDGSRELLASEQATQVVAADEEQTTVVEEPTTVEESSGNVQCDTLSSSTSVTPTERHTQPETGSDTTATVPTIIVADGPLPQSPGGTTEKHLSTMWLLDVDSPPLKQQEFEEQHASKPRGVDVAKRRRGYVEPLQVDVNTGNPDDFSSDDDEFLDELHRAEVQEAKPVTVARSPIATTFPIRRPSGDIVRPTIAPKAISNSVTASSEPAIPPARIASPSHNEKDPGTGRARNVSSGISKRIQALTDMSNRECNGSMQYRPSTSDGLPSAFPSFREQRSTKTPPLSRPTSFRRLSKNGTVAPSPAMASGGENVPTWKVQHDPVTNRNSISVSTRIKPSGTTLTPAAVEQIVPIRESIVEVPTGTAPESAPLSPVHSTTSSGGRSHASRGSRFGKHGKSSSPGTEDLPPPQSNGRGTPNMPANLNDDITAPKEGSKTSRFFKRMSNLGPRKKNISPASNSSNSLISNGDGSNGNALQVADKRASVTTQKSDTPPAALVGDLNVQFPDSLLWKRRVVSIDESGHLSFAIGQAFDVHKAVAMRKFPLAELAVPHVPDLDRQELPHSVVLEFDDGTALQIACEDAMTQRQVLSVLKTYWKAWAERA